MPEKTNAVTDPELEEKAHALDHGETASHALATGQAGEHDELGAVQLSNKDEEVKDLGWHAPEDQVPAPLVGGMDNQMLWMLVRRFNHQMYHVKETMSPVPGNLDLNIADEDEFSPDKLRSVVERLYMTVVCSASEGLTGNHSLIMASPGHQHDVFWQAHNAPPILERAAPDRMLRRRM